MAKIRINKLALELNIQNDQIIDELLKKDVPVKNYMSSIDGESADYIREIFSKTVSPAKAKAKTKAKAAPKAKAKAKAKAAPKAKAATKTASKTDAEAPVKTEAVEAPKISETQKPAPKAAPTEAEEKDAAKGNKRPGLKIFKQEIKEEKPKEPESNKKTAPAAPKKEAAHPSSEKPKTKSREIKKEAVEPPPQVVEEGGFEMVQLSENMPIRDLAEKLKTTPNGIIKELMLFGVMANINQSLDLSLASKVADKLGFEVEVVSHDLELDVENSEPDLPEDRLPRAPIVTIMGHVDHGKTSLLDTIRKTNVTDLEKGGITQHIGAYKVDVKNTSITFLDTPGHEAFTAMRARGAQVTDVVVLVVAADDGIKPQTQEAIDHANAAGVPILVAINKIDKPDAKPDEVQKQLADVGLLPESWGGQTIFAQVSAKQGTGIDNLLDMILLQAEIMELKANPKLLGQGVVIESKLDKGRGPVATVVVQKGTVRIGDPFTAGCYFGKVRALINDHGKKKKEAGPSTPVEILGLPEVPNAGDKFFVVRDERKARQISSQMQQKMRELSLNKTARVTMDDLHRQIEEGEIKELNVILKADVQGSIQAVKEAFGKLDSDAVRIKVIHGSVGGITESDVLLSTASNAIVIGFNVRPTDQARELAEKESVDLRLYNVIYDAIEDMKKALEGLLEPKFTEKIMGRAEVREVYTIPKVGVIAGCMVVSGNLERNQNARLVRDSVVVYDGKIGSLRRFKDDVKEVPNGYECGLALEKYQDIKQGDIVEPYILEEVAR